MGFRLYCEDYEPEPPLPGYEPEGYVPEYVPEYHPEVDYESDYCYLHYYGKGMSVMRERAVQMPPVQMPPCPLTMPLEFGDSCQEPEKWPLHQFCRQSPKLVAAVAQHEQELTEALDRAANELGHGLLDALGRDGISILYYSSVLADLGISLLDSVVETEDALDIACRLERCTRELRAAMRKRDTYRLRLV